MTWSEILLGVDLEIFLSEPTGFCDLYKKKHFPGTKEKNMRPLKILFDIDFESKKNHGKSENYYNNDL